MNSFKCGVPLSVARLIWIPLYYPRAAHNENGTTMIQIARFRPKPYCNADLTKLHIIRHSIITAITGGIYDEKRMEKENNRFGND
ncbi:hypothetical protein GCM10007362_19220 [Saccharibacillus endophyticus]|uniref:Uncharacterized protein n=1 Tax=Saccharibacillus endophyticus TaxID=2060666 RepID=A0ABQ1ZRF1_9BACL|nr:hypothetical protein GCM10007362_19220 [Saccharibacillus endophyticus]